MTQRIPRAARDHAPAGTTIVHADRLSPGFIKYHLDDGRVLHRFTQPDFFHPHDHPFDFDTEIIEGGYVEEVFHVGADGGWRSELVHRNPGTVHHILATHIHRIVDLPTGECWTLTRYGPHRRQTRFWRFGDRIESRAWNERHWKAE